MTLKEYFSQHPYNLRNLSKKIGIAKSHLCRIASGQLLTSIKFAQKISEGTDYQVLARDLRPDIYAVFEAESKYYAVPKTESEH